MTTGPVILCLNSGSSSLKFTLYQLGEVAESVLAVGAVERIGLPEGRSWLRVGTTGVTVDEPHPAADHQAAVQHVFATLDSQQLPAPLAVGHRVVHGGADYSAPVRVEERLVEHLRQLVAYAPLHMPAAIQGIEAVMARFPDLPQVACFDTAFHRRMPELAQRFPLPRALWDSGVRRYGFHGLSYESIVAQVGAANLARAVIAHLGNGASLSALRDGQPVETTMGLTPTGGVMMGTRSGDLDPGVLLHLLTEAGYNPAQLAHLLQEESGLLGVSGRSPDMQTLLERREHDHQARQAVEMFCYHLRKAIGALTAVLGGLDTLVFTGGIGEHAAPVRWDICHGLEHLGVWLDPYLNERHAAMISTPESHCIVRVVSTDEALIIARHTYNLVKEAL
ncbi:MAG: acetate/propionate family kinase [Candidatus Tectimicrobiota bacterium]